jgi:hypothetical protein
LMSSHGDRVAVISASGKLSGPMSLISGANVTMISSRLLTRRGTRVAHVLTPPYGWSSK